MWSSFDAVKNGGGSDLQDDSEVVRVEVGERWQLHAEHRLEHGHPVKLLPALATRYPERERIALKGRLL